MASFADHFEMWMKENNHKVPERNTVEWTKKYERWINGYCFKDFK